MKGFRINSTGGKVIRGKFPPNPKKSKKHTSLRKYKFNPKDRKVIRGKFPPVRVLKDFMSNVQGFMVLRQEYLISLTKAKTELRKAKSGWLPSKSRGERIKKCEDVVKVLAKSFSDCEVKIDAVAKNYGLGNMVWKELVVEDL